jgi:hypothetical protein
VGGDRGHPEKGKQARGLAQAINLAARNIDEVRGRRVEAIRAAKTAAQKLSETLGDRAGAGSPCRHGAARPAGRPTAWSCHAGGARPSPVACERPAKDCATLMLCMKSSSGVDSFVACWFAAWCALPAPAAIEIRVVHRHLSLWISSRDALLRSRVSSRP